MLRCVDPSLSTIANTGQITRKVHMVTDDGEIQGTGDLEHSNGKTEDVISHKSVNTIDVFMDEDTTSQPKKTWMCILSTSQRGTKHLCK